MSWSIFSAWCRVVLACVLHLANSRTSLTFYDTGQITCITLNLVRNSLALTYCEAVFRFVENAVYHNRAAFSFTSRVNVFFNDQRTSSDDVFGGAFFVFCFITSDISSLSLIALKATPTASANYSGTKFNDTDKLMFLKCFVHKSP